MEYVYGFNLTYKYSNILSHSFLMILITLITAVLAKYSCNTESYLGLNEEETIR